MYQQHLRMVVVSLVIGMLGMSGVAADSSRMVVSMVKKPKGAIYAFAYSRGKQVVMRKYIYKDVRVFEIVRDGVVLATLQAGEKENRCSVNSTTEGLEVVFLGKGRTFAFERIEIRKGKLILEAYFFDEKLNLTPVSYEQFQRLNKPKDGDSTGGTK